MIKFTGVVFIITLLFLSGCINKKTSDRSVERQEVQIDENILEEESDGEFTELITVLDKRPRIEGDNY